MIRHYIVREGAAKPWLSVPVEALRFVDGVDDHVEGDEWGGEGKRARYSAEDAAHWAPLLGATAVRDGRDPPERVDAPSRDDRAKAARKERGDGIRKERRAAEEKAAREAERDRREAIQTALAANDEPAALALMTDEERGAHEERKRVAEERAKAEAERKAAREMAAADRVAKAKPAEAETIADEDVVSEREG